jgi:AAA family ATP:ADP antiporter
VIFIIIGSNILRRFSWFQAAILTPIMILVTSMVFFGIMMYTQSHSPLTPFMGTTMVMIAILFGMAQNILTKATKYSLFDPTKEMSYIPLDQELKVKGKAAVEVLAGRGGKSGGALITSNMTIIFAGATLASLAHILAVIVIGVVIVWMLAVKSLGKRFTALTQLRAEEAAAHDKAAAMK